MMQCTRELIINNLEDHALAEFELELVNGATYTQCVATTGLAGGVIGAGVGAWTTAGFGAWAGFQGGVGVGTVLGGIGCSFFYS